jgi:hypothetical protein
MMSGRQICSMLCHGNRHKMNKSVLMFKILNNHSASNLKDKFITRDINLSTNYNLRNADINLSVPKPRTEYLKKVLDIAGLFYGIVYLRRQSKQNL